MATKPFSLRLSDATAAALADFAERSELPARTLAQRYVEEGLRMDRHPLIRFVDGPTGRRAALVGRGDVWEVIATVRDNDGDEAAAAEYLGMSLGLVQAAIMYYGSYPHEIDDRIERNERETEEAHAAWLAGRAALED